MEHRSIGPLSVSRVGLGCNNFGRKLGPDDSAAVVETAVELGITYFDTADRYGYGDHPYSGTGRSEEFLGQALAGRRERYVVATKFGNAMSDDPTMRGASPAWVRTACEGSLRRLRTDYIDLYQIHSPDPSTPIADTLGALDELVTQGKVRVIGCSNFTAAQVREAEAVADQLGSARFQSVQNEYSLLIRDPEEGVLGACEELDLAFLPYFPLASGMLTGKYRRGQPAPEGTRLAFWKPRAHFDLEGDVMDRIERLSRFAEDAGRTLHELALSWLLARPRVVSVTPGATSPEQVRGNAEAAGWRMTPAEIAAVDAL